MTRGTTVTADDDLPVVRITREFAATRRRCSAPTPTPTSTASG